MPAVFFPRSVPGFFHFCRRASLIVELKGRTFAGPFSIMPSPIRHASPAFIATLRSVSAFFYALPDLFTFFCDSPVSYFFLCPLCIAQRQVFLSNSVPDPSLSLWRLPEGSSFSSSEQFLCPRSIMLPRCLRPPRYNRTPRAFSVEMSS